MLRPKIFIVTIVLLLLIMASGFVFTKTLFFREKKDGLAVLVKKYNNAPRNITLIFVDITVSDSNQSWITSAFRKQFINAVDAGITRSEDVLAAYLIHGKTIDEQPFWTNFTLSNLPPAARDDSSSLIAGALQKEQCIEALDSLVVKKLLSSGNQTDSMLAEFTDIFGALQQAAVYFRSANFAPGDNRRIFLLSDARENAGFVPGNIKLNNIGSIDSARTMAHLAWEQLKRTTDIRNELGYADIYIHTPNDRLFYNDERNLRRIFWKNLLENNLHCRKLHFF